MVDDTTEATDARIATHIVNVHRYQQAALNAPYQTDDLQHYIRYARSIKPEVTPEVGGGGAGGAGATPPATRAAMPAGAG